MMPKQHQWWVNLPEKPQSQIVPGKQKMMRCTCMLWAAFWCLMPGNVVLSLCADRWRPKCPVCAITSRPCPGGGHPCGLCTSPSWVSEGQSQHSRTELEVGAYVLVSASGDNEQKPVSHVVHGRHLHLSPLIVPELCLCLKSNFYKPIQMLGVDKMLKLDCWETEALLLTMHLQLQPSEPILSTCVFWKALGAFSATYMQIMKAPCIYLFLRIICMRM